jgi:hypothetical protein
MALNGEYTPTVYGKMTLEREYQCRLCGAELSVRRSKSLLATECASAVSTELLPVWWTPS